MVTSIEIALTFYVFLGVVWAWSAARMRVWRKSTLYIAFSILDKTTECQNEVDIPVTLQ